MLFALSDDSPVSWLPAPPRPLIPTGEIHVWRALLDREGWPEEEALPAGERGRATAIQIPERRRRWVAARWALRMTLSRYIDEEPAELRIDVADGGKPRLAGEAAVRFNLSHSGELALIAIASDREVGIDVERIRPGRPDSRFRDWARREALAKCAGSGILGAPPEGPFRVSDIDPGAGWAAAVAVAGTEEAGVRAYRLDTELRVSAGRR
jgi:4'-phosphopantetheinyl transferase